MQHEEILLGGARRTGARLVTYVRDNVPEIAMDRLRPALIICPGGGYRF